MKTTVVYHSADYDGIFCREIARKFRPEAELIGWNFGDPPMRFPTEGMVYVMDLPLDKPFMGYPNPNVGESRIVWIDHHKSAIESHPKNTPGYRIDGVAACRLAWQWFTALFGGTDYPALPTKQDFIDRKVTEPLAVRLAGEYDIWDRRDPRAGVFQYGLRSAPITPEGWTTLLSDDETFVSQLLRDGEACERYAQSVDAANMKASFLTVWEGLKFLCLNGRGNSKTFASQDTTASGHDALLMFYYNGRGKWVVSLYHSNLNTGLDLSPIAVKYGGGGHRGACGFTCEKLPFMP